MNKIGILLALFIIASINCTLAMAIKEEGHTNTPEVENRKFKEEIAKKKRSAKTEIYKSKRRLHTDCSQEVLSENILEILRYLSNLETNNDFIDQQQAEDAHHVLFKVPPQQAISLLIRCHKQGLVSSENYTKLMINFMALTCPMEEDQATLTCPMEGDQATGDNTDNTCSYTIRKHAINSFFKNCGNMSGIVTLLAIDRADKKIVKNSDPDPFSVLGQKLVGCGALIQKNCNNTLKKFHEKRRHTPPTSELVYQIGREKTKYGFYSRDMVRLLHPSETKTKKPETGFSVILSFMSSNPTKREKARKTLEKLQGQFSDTDKTNTNYELNYLESVCCAKTKEKSDKELIESIRIHKLELTHIGMNLQKDVEVLKEALPNMGPTALLRSLGKFTSLGLFEERATEKTAIDIIKSGWQRAGLSQLLMTKTAYLEGSAPSSDYSWTVNSEIQKTLEECLKLACTETAGEKMDNTVFHVPDTPSMKDFHFKKGSCLKAMDFIEHWVQSVTGNDCFIFSKNEFITTQDDSSKISSNTKHPKKAIIIIMIDVTSSMRSGITGVQSAVMEIINTLGKIKTKSKRSRKTGGDESPFKLGIVAYDDIYQKHPDDYARLDDIWYISPTSKIKSETEKEIEKEIESEMEIGVEDFANNIYVKNGADLPEDVAGGLETTVALFKRDCLQTDDDVTLTRPFASAGYRPAYTKETSRVYGANPKLAELINQVQDLHTEIDENERRLTIHITDAPPHGQHFSHADNFPTGDPYKRNTAHLFNELMNIGSSYLLLDMSDHQLPKKMFDDFSLIYKDRKKRGEIKDWLFTSYRDMSKRQGSSSMVDAIKNEIIQAIESIRYDADIDSYLDFEMSKPLREARNLDKKIDQFVIFTDEEKGMNELTEEIKKYKKTNPKVRVFLVTMVQMKYEVPKELKSNLILLGLNEQLSSNIEMATKIMNAFTPAEPNEAGITPYKERLCPICFEDFTRIVAITSCKHCFHKECIEQWFNHSKTCPCCRKQQEEDDQLTIHELK